MIATAPTINFNTLLSDNNRNALLHRLIQLESSTIAKNDERVIFKLNKYLKDLKVNPFHKEAYSEKKEKAATDNLILLFNMLFSQQNVRLVRGQHEPEYFPPHTNNPARIEFAHGFFSSALHEISHWCIAGKRRRLLSDFGYWYAPDGRTAAQQQAFERLEIKPQALECLFTLACGRKFQVSQDSLFANFDTSKSTFSKDVYQQTASYIDQPQYIPSDAKTLLQALLFIDTIKYPLKNIK